MNILKKSKQDEKILMIDKMIQSQTIKNLAHPAHLIKMSEQDEKMSMTNKVLESNHCAKNNPDHLIHLKNRVQTI